MTGDQLLKIRKLRQQFGDQRSLKEVEAGFHPGLGLPDDWVQGWIRYGSDAGHGIFVGIAPDGESHS